MRDAHIYRVGGAEVARVQECTLENFTVEMLLPEWRAEFQTAPDDIRSAAIAPDGEHVLLSIHTWVVRDQGRTILIDTGAGNDKPRPYARYFDHLNSPYLERLATIGVVPEEVDYVLLTHLHVDHVGWNTRLVAGSWTATFPNARYIFSRAEHSFFTDPANHNERNRTSFEVQRDSVNPVIDAELAEMIDVDGSEVIPGFAFHPTPGHTANHASIVLSSNGQHALFSGDVLHHPLQVFHPDLISIFDADRDRTLESRNWALSFAADREALFFSSHFPSTSAGRVRRVARGFTWVFE